MTSTPRMDWGWRHGPVSGPVHAAVALTAAGTVGTLPAVGLTPELVLAGGAVAAGAVTVRSRYDGSTWPRLIYRLATIGGASVWLAEAVTSGWSGTLAWTLAAGAAAAGVLWRPVRAHDERAAAQRAARLADAREQERLHGLADAWVKRIATVCRVNGCRVVEIESWVYPGPDGNDRVTGYTLEVVLPTTGVTWRTLAAHADGLAAAADLPEGCGVEVGPGVSRRRALVEVSTVDALRDDIPLPPITTPRTVNDPIPIGILRNGAPVAVPLRYDSAVLVGATGSGKSNELQTMLAGLLACADTLVCVIDYNGAGVALPWITPWVRGEIERSPILWAADNEAEALTLCDWLIAVIEYRKRAYHQANAARDDDKLAVSPKVPQIVLVTDEAGALGKDVKKRIAQISDRGRAAGVRTLTCSLRAVLEYIPTELLAQAMVRMGMRVTDDRDLTYLFGHGLGIAADDAPHVGYGHVRVGQTQPKVFKGYRTSPAMIREVAVAQDAWRPELDAVTAGMSPEWGRVFAARWERSAHLLAAAAGNPADRPGPGPGPSGGAEDAGCDALPDDGGDLGGMRDALDAAAEKLRDAVNAATSGSGDAERDRAEFDRIVAAEFEVVVPELLVRALVAFGDADRMHTRDLAAELGVRPETLGHLLSQLDVRPLPNAFRIGGGKPARGYRRADLEAAADRIRSGRLVPPDDVARWRPDEPGG